MSMPNRPDNNLELILMNLRGTTSSDPFIQELLSDAADELVYQKDERLKALDARVRAVLDYEDVLEWATDGAHYLANRAADTDAGRWWKRQIERVFNTATLPKLHTTEGSN